MARYKCAEVLVLSRDPAFDMEYAASAPTPMTGIYRCVGCGREETSRRSDLLPVRDHHRHTASQGLVRWRLVVWADPYPK